MNLVEKRRQLNTVAESRMYQNVHMSGIMLSLRTQCFVLYSTKSKQDGSTSLGDSNPRHTFNLSLKKAMWASVKIFIRVRFQNRVED
jgi:hypothetical protein